MNPKTIITNPTFTTPPYVQLQRSINQFKKKKSTSLLVTSNTGDSLQVHKDMPFSTKDADHDNLDPGNCAQWYHGGWWYNACQQSNLNGAYRHGLEHSHRDGVQWATFTGNDYSLKCSEMRFRPSSGLGPADLVG